MEFRWNPSITFNFQAVFSMLGPGMPLSGAGELMVEGDEWFCAQEIEPGIINLELRGFTMQSTFGRLLSSYFVVTLHYVVVHLWRENMREVNVRLLLPQHQDLVQPAIQEGFQVSLETDSFVQLRLKFADPRPGPTATSTVETTTVETRR